MFLAEFIVKTLSLLLGGAATISAFSFESWGCFFALSMAAIVGYLIGRVALTDGIRNKRGGFSSFLLFHSILLLLGFWVVIFLPAWDTPASVVILHTKTDKP